MIEHLIHLRTGVRTSQMTRELSGANMECALKAFMEKKWPHSPFPTIRNPYTSTESSPVASRFSFHL